MRPPKPRPGLPRTGLKAVVAQRRSLAGASPLPKSILAAGVATLAGMTYALMRDGSSAREFESEKQPPAKNESAASSSGTTAPFLSLDGRVVSPDRVPSYVLATSGLDPEQKLQVALCRRQAWLRATQFAPAAMLWSYAAIVLVEAAKLVKLPRGSRTAVPLGAAVVGGTIGAYYGGREGKPMMNAALSARPIEGVHRKRGQQEDALVHFIREGTKSRES